MSIKLIERDGDFLLVGTSRAITVQIHCGLQIDRYLADPSDMERYAALVRGFHDLQSDTLVDLITQFNTHFRLSRYGRGVFDPSTLAAVLGELRARPELCATPDFSGRTVDAIIAAYDQLGSWLHTRLDRQAGLPPVSLSKLLHILKPGSFWIVDSCVETILDLSGFGADSTSSFHSLGRMLKDLAGDPSYGRFIKFVSQRHRARLAGSAPDLTMFPVTTLKLLDELLWYKIPCLCR